MGGALEHSRTQLARQSTHARHPAGSAAVSLTLADRPQHRRRAAAAAVSRSTWPRRASVTVERAPRRSPEPRTPPPLASSRGAALTDRPSPVTIARRHRPGQSDAPPSHARPSRSSVAIAALGSIIVACRRICSCSQRYVVPSRELPRLSPLLSAWVFSSVPSFVPLSVACRASSVGAIGSCTQCHPSTLCRPINVTSWYCLSRPAAASPFGGAIAASASVTGPDRCAGTPSLAPTQSDRSLLTHGMTVTGNLERRPRFGRGQASACSAAALVCSRGQLAERVRAIPNGSEQPRTS